MTNEQILKKVIEKAHDNGYRSDKPFSICFMMATGGIRKEYYEYIFSHDFAKAFWGEKLIDTTKILTKDCGWIIPDILIPAWIFYLQQMVLEEEPLKYIERFI